MILYENNKLIKCNMKYAAKSLADIYDEFSHYIQVDRLE